MKNNGPNKEPCGTPEVKVKQSEASLFQSEASPLYFILYIYPVYALPACIPCLYLQVVDIANAKVSVGTTAQKSCRIE